jgi:hypothetical protein
MLRPPCLQTVMVKFQFQPALLWFHVIVMMRFLCHGLCFLVPPPLPVPLLALGLVYSRIQVYRTQILQKRKSKMLLDIS